MISAGEFKAILEFFTLTAFAQLGIIIHKSCQPLFMFASDVLD